MFFDIKFVLGHVFMYTHILLTEDLSQYANEKEKNEMSSAYATIFRELPRIYMRASGGTLVEDGDINKGDDDTSK